MSGGDAVFVIVSVTLIFAYTAYMMWVMRKRSRLLRELTQLLKDAESKADSSADDADGPDKAL